MSELVLELRNVHKAIKGKKIIKGINLELFSGEVLGFLGPNGSGKTTTLRMIVGLIRMTKGEVFIAGHSIEKDFVKAMKNVGCIIENPEMYDYLSGWENLKILASMEKGITKERMKEVVSLVGMEKRIDDKVYTYSLGMKQRLGIAQAIMKRPKLLILDEPANGLDPAGISEFRKLIQKLAHEESMAVLVSSHILAEIEMMCDRVAIIKQGEVVQVTTVKNIVKDQGIIWKIKEVQQGKKILEEEFQTAVQLKEDQTLLAFIGEDQVSMVNKRFMEADVGLLYVNKNQKSLEDLFLALTAGDEIV